MSASLVSGLMEMRNMIDQILENSGDVSTKKLNKSGKVRKESSRKGKATPHGDFTKMICEKDKDAIAAFKTANPDKKGAHLTYVSNYKKEHAEEYAAFETEWKLKHADASESEASGSESDKVADAEEKPKSKRPPMTEEHKAKLKAGREKKAAEKKAATQVEVTPQVEVAPTVEVEAEPTVEAPAPEKVTKPVKKAKKSTA